MFQQIFLAVIGFCAGVIIAGGVVGLLIGLSIVPRYAGVTHTGKHILLYEDKLRCSELFSAIFSFYIAGPFQGHGVSWPLRTFLRHFPGGMDHGTGRNGRCLSHLFPKDQADKRDPPGGNRRSPGKSTRLFVLLLSKMVSVNFPIINRREHSCPFAAAPDFFGAFSSP